MLYICTHIHKEHIHRNSRALRPPFSLSDWVWIVDAEQRTQSNYQNNPVIKSPNFYLKLVPIPNSHHRAFCNLQLTLLIAYAYSAILYLGKVSTLLTDLKFSGPIPNLKTQNITMAILYLFSYIVDNFGSVTVLL